MVVTSGPRLGPPPWQAVETSSAQPRLTADNPPYHQHLAELPLGAVGCAASAAAPHLLPANEGEES